MRIMSFRREMYCEDRHIITNVPENYRGNTATFVGWKGSPIRVSNFPQKNGEIKADMTDYTELNIFATNEDTTPEFMENYIKILRGKLPGWKLFKVELHPGGDPCLNFINENSGAEEHLFIKRMPRLQIIFEIDRADGYTDKYLLEIEKGSHNGTSMVLTEYYSHGRYEIIFDGIPLCENNSDNMQWKYIYVTETLY